MRKRIALLVIAFVACTSESRDRTDNNSDTIGSAKGLRDVRALQGAAAMAMATDTIKAYQHRDSSVAESLRVIAPLVRARKTPTATAARLDSLRSLVLRPIVVIDTPPPPPPDTTPPPPPPPPDTPPSTCALLTDWTKRPVPALSKPAYLATATDPVFGVRITRISGDKNVAIGNGISGSWGDRSMPQYSKVQAWSADGKLLVLGDMGGAVGPGVQLYLDGDTYQPLFARAHPGPEARWHPTIPDVQVYIAANGSVGHWNARTNVSTIKYNTTAYSNAYFGNYEGNPSYDGKYAVVQATKVSGGALVAYAVDVDAGIKYADIPLSSPDWPSISPLGNYVVVMGVNQIVKVYTKQGALVTTFTTPLGHADIGVDGSGREVVFGAASSGTNSKKFLAIRLDNGAITVLSPATTWDWHSSTRNYRRLGWGMGVTNDNAGSVVDGEMYFMSLDGTAVERWGPHRSAAVGNHDSFATPSPDGRRILFGSDWGTSSGPMQSYVASCQ